MLGQTLRRRARRGALSRQAALLSTSERAPPVVSSSSAGSAAEPGPAASASETHFGFRTVGMDEKVGLVHSVFAAVAPKYDVMNDVMSGGMHRLWKDSLVEALRPQPGTVHLDMAGGTGDVAFRVLDSLRRAEVVRRARGRPDPPEGPGCVVVADINPAMLAEGRKRADAAGRRSLEKALDDKGVPLRGGDLSWLEADAEKLPLADSSVDSYTIAFGLRNVTRPQLALAEAARVLRRGGRLMILEFSTVGSEPLRSLYDAYSFNAIPRLGALITGDAAPYQYLVESIRQFPPQEELAEMMREAGLQAVTYTDIMGGIVAQHSGFKL